MQQGIDRVEGSLLDEVEMPAVLSLLIGIDMERAVVSSATVNPSGGCPLFDCDWSYGEVIRCEEPLKDIYCRVYLAKSVEQQGTPRWLGKLDKLATIAQGICNQTTLHHDSRRQLLLNEIAFRFNHRNEPGASALLYSFFKNV